MADDGATEPRLVEMFVHIGRGKTLPRGTIDFKSISASKSPDGIAFNPTVLDSFPSLPPGQKPVKDAIRPDQVATFAFPDNVPIVSAPVAPKLFWFVLTGVSGARFYCASLHFYEQCDPLEVACLFLGNPEVATAPPWATPGSTVPVYSARGICVVSKYPFLWQMRAFLRQLYRISISCAPVPVEKYISNFCAETPVPPRGVIQVVVNMADTNIVLRRPPVNMLPQIGDHCLEVLFGRLSVDKVVLVWRLMLLEVKIIVGSKTRSVITPCLDALMKLLFPFFWDNVYIPILPPSLIDVLGAPLPYVVGLNAAEFESILTSRHRPENACFVDLDSGDVYFDELAETPELPHHDGSKLLKVLQGLNIDNAPEAQDGPSASPGGENAFSRRPSTLIHQEDCLFPDWDPLTPVLNFASQDGTIEHTAEGYSERRRASSSKIKHISRSSISGSVHGNFDSGAAFPDTEVRNAFLRFMCAFLQDYEKYFDDASSDILQEPFINSMDKADRPFATSLMRTQMWDGFVRDRVESPGKEGSESKTGVGYAVQFFREHIAAKVNRSIKVRKKLPTTFIDDDQWIERNKFIAPLPIPSTLPDGSVPTFTYANGFPRLIAANYGIVRKPRRIADYEVQRRANAAVAQVLMQLHAGNSVEMADADAGTDGIEVDEPQKPSASRRRSMALEKTLGIAPPKPPEAINEQQVRWQRRENMIVQAQTQWRGRVARKIFVKKRNAALTVQCAWGRMRARTPLNRKRNAALLLQRAFRQWLFVRWRQRAVTVLASGWRMYMGKRILHHAKEMCKRIQCIARGVQCRTKAQTQRVEKVRASRQELFVLWKQLEKPLLYRAKFWILFGSDHPTFLEMGVHLDELARLRDELRLLKTRRTSSSANDSGRVRSLLGNKKLSPLEEERKSVYTRLKQRVSEHTRESFFRMFGLGKDDKRRKHRLADMLFEKFEEVDSSATVMISTVAQEDIGVDWVLAKKTARINENIFSSLQGTLRVLGNQGARRAKKGGGQNLSPRSAEKADPVFELSCFDRSRSSVYDMTEESLV